MENDSITIIRDDADLIRRTMERLLSEEQLIFVPKQWTCTMVRDGSRFRPLMQEVQADDALLRTLISKRLGNG